MLNWPKTRAALALAASVAFLSGCSLTLDFEECSADTDCPAGQGLTCSTEGFCVTDGATPEPDPNPGPNPTPNPDPNPEPTPDVDPNPDPDPGPVCCTNSQCAADSGQGFICGPDCTCVNALSEECFSVEGPIDQDDILIIGSLLPTRGDNASKGVPREQAIQLAVAEFNQNGGLGSGRRLVHIGCDDGGDAEQGKRAASHLVDTVGVSAIVGPAFSGVYIDVSDQVTSPAGTFIISPSATSAAITTLSDENLSWRAVPSDAFQGGAVADRLRDLRTERGGPIRIAALGKDGTYGTGLLNKIIDEMAGEQGEEGLIGRVYDPSGDLATPVIGLIEDFGQADFVLLFGTNEIVTLIDNYEQRTVELGLNPVTYIISDGGQATELIDYIVANPEIAPRIEGVAPDGKNGTLYTAYEFRYRNRYSEEPGSFTANAYDATYLIAYAAITIPTDEPVTGAALSEGMAKLISGMDIEAGPSNIGQARNTLLSGNGIDYEGASGPLQFDLETGDVSANISLWNVVEDERNMTFEFEDVALYRVSDDGNGGQWGPPEN